MMHLGNIYSRGSFLTIKVALHLQVMALDLEVLNGSK